MRFKLLKIHNIRHSKHAKILENIHLFNIIRIYPVEINIMTYNIKNFNYINYEELEYELSQLYIKRGEKTPTIMEDIDVDFDVYYNNITIDYKRIKNILIIDNKENLYHAILNINYKYRQLFDPLKTNFIIDFNTFKYIYNITFRGMDMSSAILILHYFPIYLSPFYLANFYYNMCSNFNYRMPSKQFFKLVNLLIYSNFNILIIVSFAKCFVKPTHHESNKIILMSILKYIYVYRIYKIRFEKDTINDNYEINPDILDIFLVNDSLDLMTYQILRKNINILNDDLRKIKITEDKRE